MLQKRKKKIMKKKKKKKEKKKEKKRLKIKFKPVCDISVSYNKNGKVLKLQKTIIIN